MVFHALALFNFLFCFVIQFSTTGCFIDTFIYMYLKTSSVCLFHHVSQRLLPGTSHMIERQQDLLNKPKNLNHEPVSEKWEHGWLFKKVCRYRIWQWEVTSGSYYLQGGLKERMRKVKQKRLNFFIKKIRQYVIMMIAMERWRQTDTWSLLASEPNLLGEHQFSVEKQSQKTMWVTPEERH